MEKSLEINIDEKLSRKSCVTKGNSRQAGFGLIIILLAVAIVAILAGMYYSSRIENAQETKKSLEQHTEQVQQQVEKQIDELEKKLPENINGSTTEEGTRENE